MTMSDTPVCSGCRQVYTDDVTGLCEDCQTDVLSSRPASMTDSQGLAIIGLLIDTGLHQSSSARGELMASLFPGWSSGGDIHQLSQDQAADLLEALEARRAAR
jgi:hypothetical protein